MNIKIKYHAPIDRLEMTEKGDWCDLRSAEFVKVNKFEFVRISLGVSMELPSGFEAHVSPRSSTFRKWGLILTNSVGVIDESYKGNNDIWQAEFFATRDTAIDFNDRLLQFRIIEKQPKLNFQEVDNLASEDRGGFGSTGHK